MDNERELKGILNLMFLLNLSMILFYSMITLVTTFRVCGSFSAYSFLSGLRRLPPNPWRMPVWAMSQYLLLFAVSYAKSRWEMDRLEPRLAVCLVEILLCVGITASMNFYR